MTLDLVPLPGGYGQGSSTEAQWIARQMAADRERGRVQFPPVWGVPPAAQTRDFVPLPLGYGMGSSTLRDWIADKALASGTYSPAQLKASMEQPAKGHFVQHRTPPVVGLARFPSSWGEPPSIQTADFRPLPGGYGYGSTTLSKWIAAKMAADAQAGTMEYPPSWGKPPTAQTRDIRPLPMGYGTGSSTLGAWILERAHSAGHGHGPDLDKLNPDSHPARPLGSRARYGDLRSAHDRVRNQ